MRVSGMEQTIRDMLLKAAPGLTPAEGRITQALLAEYPSAGLGSASALARRAGVSDPTVLRLIGKLGFQGFGDFQARLLAEVEARLHSPLMMMEAKKPVGAGASASAQYLASVAASVDKLAASGQEALIERAARLIISAKGCVYLLGGRFSRHLAGMLSGYLAQFRYGVVDLGEVGSRAVDQLVDMSKADVLILFDYRRYQNDTIRFGAQAAERGAHLILFTDPWMSPLSAQAEVTLTCPVEAQSPFDTMAPALAQIEALTAHLLTAARPEARARIEALEAIRAQNAVTMDAEPALRGGPGPKPSKDI